MERMLQKAESAESAKKGFSYFLNQTSAGFWVLFLSSRCQKEETLTLLHNLVILARQHPEVDAEVVGVATGSQSFAGSWYSFFLYDADRDPVLEAKSKGCFGPIRRGTFDDWSSMEL